MPLLPAAVFVAFLLLALTAPAMEMTDLFADGPVKLIRGIGYPLLLLGAVLIARPWRDTQLLWVIPWPLLVLLAWCAFSLTWSAVPGIGLRQLVLTACSVAIPFLCVRQLGYDRSLFLLRVMLLLALIVNFVVVMLYPAIGTHDFGVVWSKGQWRGLMGHKNIAGQFAALTLIAFLFGGNGPFAKVPRYLAAAAAALFLVFTISRTSLAVAPVAVAAGGLVVLGHAGIANTLAGRHRLVLIGAGLVLCMLVVLTLLFFTFDQDALLAIATDPTALSNRGAVWEPLLRFYGDYPFSGAGFGSFWDMQAQSNAPSFNGTQLGDIVQGHNGYLDLLVQIGLPGLLLALGAVLVWPVAALPRILRDAPAASGLIAAVSVFCLGNNLTETTLLSRDTLCQVVLMIALAMMVTLRARQGARRTSSHGGKRRRVRRRSSEVTR